MTATTETPQRVSLRVRVQQLGTALSNMVMPNIGAFIAWGLITALFIKTGWLPSLFHSLQNPDGWVAHIGGWGAFEKGGIVGPMITYLLPILIGSTGGRMVYGTRGAVVGAITTMGVVAGSDVPMFMGAMIMGPLGGWVIKKLDALWDGKIRPGFEMLVNNFSAGILGMLLAIVGFFVFGPVMLGISSFLGAIVDWLVTYQLLPLLSIVVEPAKVLFLNNAINHGVFTPLGIQQAAEHGAGVPDAEPVAACTVTGIEPQAYVHQGVAEGDPAGIFRAMAHALRQAAVHRRDGREVAHTAAGREPEPHRGVVGKPFGVLVGAHLGIVAGDEVAARQRGAVGDGEPAKIGRAHV